MTAATKQRVPSDQQKIDALRRTGKSRDYIASYMRGWRLAAGGRQQSQPKDSA